MYSVRIGQWIARDSGFIDVKKKARLCRAVAIVVSPVFFVMASHHLAIQNYALAALNLFCGLTICLNTVFIQWKNKPLIPYNLIILAILITVLVGIMHLGTYSLVWSFPFLVGIAFSLETKHAVFFSALLMAGCASILIPLGDIEFVFRVFTSQLLTMVIALIMINHMFKSHDRLVETTTTDSLTGLYNRRVFESVMNEGTHAARVKNASASLVLINIDHFGRLNDRYGHSAGNDVLVAIAQEIKQVFPKGSLVFRLGGDEFMVLLYEYDTETTLEIAQKLCDKVAETNFPGDLSAKVSIGVTEITSESQEENLLKKADLALYEAKALGRNRVAIFIEDS